MKVSHSKKEYMFVNVRGSETVRSQTAQVGIVHEFKYLGLTVQCNINCGEEVKKQVQALCSGNKKMSGEICDKQVPAKVKGNVYKRPPMLYGLEEVALTKIQEIELEVLEGFSRWSYQAGGKEEIHWCW